MPPCSASGQWMLAPTDLAGANPDPTLRPNIINNSWGGDNGGAIDPWYRATLTAWTAAGIFGVFSNGNAGPSCNTTGSPADNIEAYGVGAYDINNAHRQLLEPGPRRERRDPADHLRARRERPLERRRQRLRQLQRHLDGRTPRVRARSRCCGRRHRR